MKPIRVSFLPYESWRNPYQSMLANALKKQGVHVNRPDASTLRQSMRLHLRGELDLVHFHWTSAFLLSQNRAMSVIKTSLFITACQMLKRSGVKIIWTVHNLFEHDGRDPAWERRAHRILCQLYDRIIVHCPRALEIVRQAYDLTPSNLQRFIVVPHGHFIDQYPNHVTQGEALQRFGLSGNDFVFLFFGQIRPHKNLDLLIEEFNKLDHPKAHLIIAGEPIHANMLREIQSSGTIHPRIHTYLQRIPDEEIQYFMNAANAVVLPFQDVLTSSTLILAMSFGKAVITPSSGCSPDLLIDQTELLYGAHSQDSLLVRMQDSLKMDLDAIGRSNQENIRWSDWDMVAKITAGIYTDQLSSSS